MNLLKSHLRPTTWILHLGTDSRSELSSRHHQRASFSVSGTLPQHNIIDLSNPLTPSIPVLLLSCLLRKMISCISIVPWARFPGQQLQWFMLPYQHSRRSNSTAHVPLLAKVRRSLCWWTSSALTKGCVFQEPHRLTVMTDASLSGWGAHIHSQGTQGFWSPADCQNEINWLVLHAVRLARHFQWRVTICWSGWTM